MPWYWTDEVAPVLVANGTISAEVAAALIAMPVALRSEHTDVDEATQELVEDGEIPLAA
jgi:ABC-type proline/glycine betaine transport system permease subunit